MKLMWMALSLLMSVGKAANVSTNLSSSSTVLRASSSTDQTNMDGIATEQGSSNRLPKRFYGNVPDTGIVEVCGKAGNVFRNTSLPSLTVNMKTEFWIVFMFKEDLRDFKSTNDTTYGFYMETKSNGVPEKIDFRMRGKALTDCFDLDLTTKNYVPKYSENRTMAYKNFYLYPDSDGSYHKFAIVFKKNVTIHTLKLYYSDVPREITNVVMNSLEDRDMFITEDNVYDGADKDYEEKSDLTGNSLDLEMNYGDSISEDTIRTQFLDAYSFSKVQNIYFTDPDGYFRIGKKAPLEKTYPLTMRIRYTTGNDTLIRLNIKIVDKKAPEVFPLYQLPINLNTSYDSLKDNAVFARTHFFIQDNYDTDVNIRVEDYRGNQLLGDNICDIAARIRATDSHQNETVYSFSLNAYDAVGPKINQSVSEVSTTPEEKLSIEDLLSYFYAEDEIEGIVNVSIYNDEYTTNYDKIGDYKFVVSAKDSKENMSIATMIVKVREKESSYWTGYQTDFTFTYGSIPPIEEIMESLIRQTILPETEYTGWEQLSGETYDNTLTIGLHEIEIRFYPEEGEPIDVLLSIKVIEAENEAETEEELSWWAKFCKWWIDLWAAIVRFFTGK